jgi:hypothetical protein
MEELIPLPKAASILHAHPVTLRRAIARGELRAIRTPTARYMISPADLWTWARKVAARDLVQGLRPGRRPKYACEAERKEARRHQWRTSQRKRRERHPPA